MTDDETNAPEGEFNEKKEPGAAAPSPLQTPPQDSNEKNDIAHILEGVKLPERRDFKAAADTPKEAPEPAILEEHIVKAASKDKKKDTAPAATSENVASSVTAVRTLKDDLQTVVREKNISLVRAVSLEEEKKRGQEKLAPEQDEIQKRRGRRAMGVLFASGILIVLGVGAVFGVFFVMEQKQAPTAVPVASSILFSEQTETISIDNLSPQALKSALVAAEGQQLGSLGSITQIVPVVAATGTDGEVSEQPATISEFFAALGITDLPPELMEAIGPNFFFGIHVVDVNAPLFVIPVTSYDHAFAGMLAWEGTMDADLAPVFTSVPSTIMSSSGVPETRTFQDVVLRNYDARALEDDSGNIDLYYSFPTPDILVIAQSPYTFTEVLSRLQAQREL